MFLGLITSVVTDLELTASQTVKTILMLILATGVLLNIFWAYKTTTVKKKISRAMIAILLFLIIIPVLRWYDIENQLLNHKKYTTGTTLAACQVFAKGAGIEFTYEVEGVEYRNCNTYHPYKLEQIIVPDGAYYVRFSKKYPDKGRIDFTRQVK